MNDRELLDDHELLKAAYAAHRPGQNYIRLVNDAGRDYWNPLEDDGDAFRLMVNLNLLTKFTFLKFMAEENDNPAQDYYAATRRAIVRAAAEIGKEMK
jgi:hypothetical protein